MALARIKTWVAGDTLTAADLNAEINNLLNNPISLISPTTGAINFQTSVLHTNLIPSAISGTTGAAGQPLTLTGGGVTVWGNLLSSGISASSAGAGSFLTASTAVTPLTLWSTSLTVFGTPQGITIGTTLQTGLAGGDIGIGVTNALRGVNNAGTNYVSLIAHSTNNDEVYLSPNGSAIRVGVANTTMGSSGITSTLGTIGGSGPATAGQSAWLQIVSSTGGNFWIPIWQ